MDKKESVREGKIILLTGGMRSGKSSYGEALLKDFDNVLYVATAMVTDDEMEERIRRHRKSRNPKWRTYEGFSNLDKVICEAKEDYIFLDCVTNMINNLMFNEGIDFERIVDKEKEELFIKIKGEFIKLIQAVRKMGKSLVLITNEVGMGLISEYKLGRIFTDFTGFINQYIAGEADEVIFMVSGQAMKVK